MQFLKPTFTNEQNGHVSVLIRMLSVIRVAVMLHWHACWVFCIVCSGLQKAQSDVTVQLLTSSPLASLFCRLLKGLYQELYSSHVEAAIQTPDYSRGHMIMVFIW